MAIEKQAPQGEFRVIGVDLSYYEDYLVDDYETREKAVEVTDAHNKERTGGTDDIYYAYNDAGKRIRGNEAGNQEVNP